MITTLFNLLVIYQLKHFICDYMMQDTYMLGKFNRVGWFKPLAAHSLVHAIGTFMICIVCTEAIWFSLILAGIDCVIHGVIDKLKVEASRPYDSKTDKEFWYLLGADQFFHHITHYLIIASIMSYLYDFN